MGNKPRAERIYVRAARVDFRIAGRHRREHSSQKTMLWRRALDFVAATNGLATPCLLKGEAHHPLAATTGEDRSLDRNFVGCTCVYPAAGA